MKNRLLIYLFCAITLMGAFFYFTSINHDPKTINDSSEYLWLSQNIIEGQSYYAGDLEKTIDYRLYSKRPPLYSLFLALSLSISLHFITFVQVAFFILSYFIGLSICLMLKPGKRSILLIYSFLYLLSIPLAISSQFILADHLLGLCILLCLYVFLHFQRNKNPSYLHLLGLFWSFALLTKPIILPSLILIPVLIGYLKSKAIRVKFALFLPILVAISISGMNYYNSQYFHYSSIASINKAHYNAKLLIGYKYGLDSAEQFCNGPGFEIPHNASDFKQNMHLMDQKAGHAISQNLFDYAKIHLVGMLKMLVDPGRFELYTFSGTNTKDISLTQLWFSGRRTEAIKHLQSSPFLFGLFLFLLLVGLIKSALFIVGIFSYTEKGKWLTISVIAYFFILTGPIGAFRFLIPVYPLFLVICSLGGFSLNRVFPKRF